MKSAYEYSEILRNGCCLASASLKLGLPEFVIDIRSNHLGVIDGLTDYFRYMVISDDAPANCTIDVYDQAPLALDLPWVDWKREEGKAGKKDAFVDVDDQTRLLLKVRTGMVFFQSNSTLIASGPCLENLNQVINFINNQYMNQLQQQGWLICHAAALSTSDKAIAFAGMSGGGKSTTMLKVMDQADTKFISNDRLFIRPSTQGIDVRGIPKLPRINPGTLLHNPALISILTPEEIEQFQALPKQELWELEHKYDVDIERQYGQGRISFEGNLTAFVVLRWHPKNTGPTVIERIDIADKPELLQAIMKPAGPFFQYSDGHFDPNLQSLDPAPYLDMLSGNIPVVEVSGGVDFEAVTEYCWKHLL